MNHTDNETWRARVHLAAANRLAVHDDLEEGIDNHFTMRVPGEEDRYLVLPFGLHWSEARASDLIVFNEAGEVLEGSGSLELSALSIHAPLHRITGANVLLHTHQNWALALNMLEDNRLLPASQTAAFLTGNIAYVLAMSTGRPLAVLDEAMVKRVERPNPRNSHAQAEREALYFAAMMRVLDRQMPGYAD